MKEPILQQTGQKASALAYYEGCLYEAGLVLAEVVECRESLWDGLGCEEDEAVGECGEEGEGKDDRLGQEELRRQDDGFAEEVDERLCELVFLPDSWA